MSFWVRAAADPSWIAVVEPDGTQVTAGDLLSRVNRLTSGLQARGLRPGDGIAALLPNGAAAFEVMLAAAQGGWYLTPLNWHFAAPELAYILTDAETRAFFVAERFAGLGAAAADLAGLPPGIRFGYGDVPGATPADDLLAGQPASAPAERTAGTTMHYTSGTTGRPKGVRRALSGLSPEDAADLGAALPQLFGVTDGPPNVHLVTSPIYHTGRHGLRRQRAAPRPHGGVHGRRGTPSRRWPWSTATT